MEYMEREIIEFLSFIKPNKINFLIVKFPSMSNKRS